MSEGENVERMKELMMMELIIEKLWHCLYLCTRTGTWNNLEYRPLWLWDLLAYLFLI